MCISLVDSPHGHFNHGKGTCAHRHSPEKRRSNALPEAPDTISAPCGREAGAHGRVLLLGAEAVRLHLALDDVEGVASQPEDLAGETSVQGDLVGGDLLAVDAVARSVGVHEVLESSEPGAVGKGLSPDGHDLAPVEAAQGAVVGADLADAVQGPVVQASLAVRLALQADTDVLDGSGQRRIGYTGKGSGQEVLAVAKFGGPTLGGVASLKPPTSSVESAELHGHTSADTDEGRQRALVEGQGAFILVDGGSGLESASVLVRRLQTDFDDIEGLAWEERVSNVGF